MGTTGLVWGTEQAYHPCAQTLAGIFGSQSLGRFTFQDALRDILYQQGRLPGGHPALKLGGGARRKVKDRGGGNGHSASHAPCSLQGTVSELHTRLSDGMWSPSAAPSPPAVPAPAIPSSSWFLCLHSFANAVPLNQNMQHPQASLWLTHDPSWSLDPHWHCP